MEFDENTKKLLQAGKDQEPVTLQRFLKNRKSDHIFEKTEFHHPKHHFMFCHPDLIYKEANKWINVEAKFVKHKSDEWNFNDLTENGIPFRYYLQCQYQMMVTGINKTILCCNYLGADHYEFEFKANLKLYKTFEKICFDFWKLVENKEPPMPSSREDVKKLFPNKNFKALTIPEEIADDTIMQKDRFNFLKFRIKEMKKEQDRIGATIKTLMGPHNVLQNSEGEQIASITEWKEEKIKALSKIKDTDPEIYKYLKRKGAIEEISKSRFNF